MLCYIEAFMRRRYSGRDIRDPKELYYIEREVKGKKNSRCPVARKTRLSTV